jgi:hypothetical protein
MKKGMLPFQSDSIYSQVSGVDLSSTDWTPPYDCATGLLISGTGNLKIDMYQGGTVTIPITVAAGDFFELEGYAISRVYKTGTTVAIIGALF